MQSRKQAIIIESTGLHLEMDWIVLDLLDGVYTT